MLTTLVPALMALGVGEAAASCPSSAAALSGLTTATLDAAALQDASALNRGILDLRSDLACLSEVLSAAETQRVHLLFALHAAQRADDAGVASAMRGVLAIQEDYQLPDWLQAREPMLVQGLAQARATGTGAGARLQPGTWFVDGLGGAKEVPAARHALLQRFEGEAGFRNWYLEGQAPPASLEGLLDSLDWCPPPAPIPVEPWHSPAEDWEDLALSALLQLQLPSCEDFAYGAYEGKNCQGTAQLVLQGLTRGRGPLSFHWDGRLGLDYDTDMDAAHWARDFYSEASADDPRAPLRALEIRTTGGPGLRFLLPQGEARLHLGPLLQYSRSSRRLTERLEDEYRVSPLGSSGRLGAQLGGVLELELRNGMRLGPRLDLRLSRQAALSFSELTEEQLADDPSDEQLLRAEHAWTWIELLPALDFSLELAGLQPAALQLQLGFPYLVFRHRGGESLELLRQVYGDGVDTQDHSTLLLFSLGAQGRFGP